MKRFLFFPLFMSVVGLYALPVGRQQAQEIAERLLGKPVREVTASVTRATVQTFDVAYYVYNAGDGCGFAIISADDSAGDVLGYSTTHAFPADKALPCALQLYLDSFSENVQALRRDGMLIESEGQAANVSGPAFAASPHEGLCRTSWGQDAPYNTLCPEKGGQRCPTGCVATAMAQLLYYWQWPESGKGYSWAKDGIGETYSGTLEHEYQWSAMKATTIENKASEEASKAVAQLMYDCGLSVNMDYNTDGSGARTPVNALYKNFSYIPSTMRLHFRDCYTEDEWLSLIRYEIDHRRIVYHTATSSLYGGKDAAGHAFLVDGYDEHGNVHVNWGWDGDFNGFYAVSRMNPGGYAFTITQAIIVGIEPARHGEVGDLVEYPYMKNPPVCSKSGSITKTTSFNITVGGIYNLNANAHTWQITIGIFDPTNQMLGEVKTGRVPSLTLNPGYVVIDDYAIVACRVGSTYPDGDYALRVLFRDAPDGEWILPDMEGGIKKNAVYIRIRGNRIEFTDGSDYIATSVQAVRSDAMIHPADGLTRVFDASGRQVYSAPTSSFNLWDIPARGVLVVKQGNRVRKVVR